MDQQVIELVESNYTLDASPKRRGWLPPDAIVGDVFLWPTERAYRHLQASRDVADAALWAAAEGDGYVVDPTRCPDTLPA